MKLRSQAILILLFAVFALPPLLSWFLFNYTDMGREPGAGEHGTLVIPPRPVPDLTMFDMSEQTGTEKRLHGKWTLLYLLDGECQEACLKNLYKMRQLRLATGKYARRVQRVILVTDNNQRALTQGQLQAYPGQLILFPENLDSDDLQSLFKLSTDDSPFVQQRLYLIDPLGNLMMSYDANTEPGGIIKDLKRLLKYSQVG